MISSTKRQGCIPATAFLIAIVIVGVMAFQSKPSTSEKQYHVTFTPDEWQMRLQFLDNAKQIMSKSTLPANVVSQWSDSLTKFETEIAAQVQKQMAADTLHKK